MPSKPENSRQKSQHVIHEHAQHALDARSDRSATCDRTHSSHRLRRAVADAASASSQDRLAHRRHRRHSPTGRRALRSHSPCLSQRRARLSRAAAGDSDIVSQSVARRRRRRGLTPSPSSTTHAPSAVALSRTHSHPPLRASPTPRHRAGGTPPRDSDGTRRHLHHPSARPRSPPRTPRSRRPTVSARTTHLRALSRLFAAAALDARSDIARRR